MRASRDGVAVFEDSRDHLANGVCRLLGIDEAKVRSFVEAAVADRDLRALDAPEIVDRLRNAAALVLGGEPPAGAAVRASGSATSGLGHRADHVIASALPTTDRVMIVGSSDARIGWLVDAKSLKPPHEPLIAYESEYFEGDVAKVGYGSYLSQQAWRLEKGRRYTMRMANVLRLCGVPMSTSPRLLDIGSGYGFFRKAAQEAGWAHDGLEISRYAADVARRLFSFDTIVGTIDDLPAVVDGTYDLITLWDTIEHVPDPLGALRLIAERLDPGGVLFLRTPNLDALEREVFGWRYHSFKEEHLYYFGVPSLVRLIERAGLRVIHLATDSHLLRGLLDSRLSGFEAALQGSDFFVAATRSAGGAAA